MSMKLHRILILCFCIFYCRDSFAQKQKPIDVYFIGGQSNATGQGYIQNMADSMKIDTAVWIFYSGKPHINTGKTPYTWQPLHQASESPDRFGPELGFGNKIHQLNPGKKIALIKHAHSGTNLYKEWNPGKNAQDTLNWGPQFKEFIHTVTTGLDGLRKMGYKPIIRGMLWQQGESDATKDSVSRLYAQNLVNFIHRVRQQLHQPRMPFIYGYVLPPPNKGNGRDIVRQAEHDIDQDSGNKIAVKHAYVVQTDDLSQRYADKNTPYPNDHIHFGTDGIWTLGVRMAYRVNSVK
jgi:hypothetical protein